MDHCRCGGYPTVEGVLNKRLPQFMDHGRWGEVRGKHWEWESTGYQVIVRKSVLVSHSSPHKESSAEIPEEDLGPRPKMKRSKNEGTGVGV